MLGGISIPGEPRLWQQKLLSSLGMGEGAINGPLRRSGDMFDWRTVAAVRLLCAEKEKDLTFKTLQHLGDLSKCQAPEIEVRHFSERLLSTSKPKVCEAPRFVLQ